jgi:hypothetical protein
MLGASGAGIRLAKAGVNRPHGRNSEEDTPMNRYATLTLTALALSAALGRPSPSHAASAARCQSGTYTMSPGVPDLADTRISLHDGVVTMPGCAAVAGNFQKAKGDRTLVIARAKGCEGLRGSTRLKLVLESDCASGRGALRRGKPAFTTTTFTATSEVPASSVTMDPTLAPAEETIPPTEAGEGPRPVAALADASGQPAEFVADELLLQTDDPTVLADFVARWNGTVLSTLSFAEYGLEGPTFHRVRIDLGRADIATLSADLSALNPGRPTNLRVSSEAALQLLSASASENVAGVPVALNFLTTNAAYSDRSLKDGTGFGNAFLQKHLRRRCRTDHRRDRGLASPRCGRAPGQPRRRRGDRSRLLHGRHGTARPPAPDAVHAQPAQPQRTDEALARHAGFPNAGSGPE